MKYQLAVEEFYNIQDPNVILPTNLRYRKEWKQNFRFAV